MSTAARNPKFQVSPSVGSAAGLDDTDYSNLAADYAAVRRPDPRIGAQFVAALGEARRVLNVGAGNGSYEPTDRQVVAVEPAAEMRARRDPALPPAIDATAEALPFDDDSFDAALAVFTVHHWPDLEAASPRFAA